MKVLAWVALSVSTIAGACESDPNPRSTGMAEPERAAVFGAGPGAFLPSTCMGRDDVRAWRRAAPRDVPIEIGARETWAGSHCDWSVVMHDGAPIVSADHPRTLKLPVPVEETTGRLRAVQDAGPGVLLGFDGGEWGGSLTWYEKTTGAHRLLDSNVVAILPAFGNFIALTYEGHGSRGRGVELRVQGGRLEIAKTVDLPGAPMGAGVESDGTILVATGKGLLRLSHDLQVRPVLDAEWWILHPVNLAIGRAGIVYVGMRGIVVEVQMTTDPPTETWLFPF
jgi:hypothetical protein